MSGSEEVSGVEGIASLLEGRTSGAGTQRLAELEKRRGRRAAAETDRRRAAERVVEAETQYASLTERIVQIRLAVAERGERPHLDAATVGESPTPDPAVVEELHARLDPHESDMAQAQETRDEAVAASRAADEVAQKSAKAEADMEEELVAADATPMGEEVARAQELELAEEAARAEIAAQRLVSDKGLMTLGRVTFAAYSVITAFVLIRKLPPPSAWGLQWSMDKVTPDLAAVVTATLAWLVVLLLMLATRGSGGLRRLMIGSDGRFSTSMLQGVLWTAVLFYALLFLGIRDAATCTKSCGTPFDELDLSYLVLLGGPFAAAAAARAAVASKVAAGSLQKVQAETTAVRDVVTDDEGCADLVDTQFLLFNIVALVYFLFAFVGGTSNALPTLPEGLVALTSLGALTYATNKAIATNAPLVRSVTRAGGQGPIRPGDAIEIRGSNFIPPGASGVEYLALVKVKFGDVIASLEPGDLRVNSKARERGRAGLTKALRGPVGRKDSASAMTSSLLRARVTLGIDAGVHEVTVVTAAGAVSDPVRVEVVDDTPFVLAVVPSVITPGDSLRVMGRAFDSATIPGQVFVRVGPHTVAAESVVTKRGGVQSLWFQVPDQLEAKSVEIRVISTSGEESAPLRVRVEQPDI